jgi:hypothetical protein
MNWSILKILFSVFSQSSSSKNVFNIFHSPSHYGTYAFESSLDWLAIHYKYWDRSSVPTVGDHCGHSFNNSIYSPLLGPGLIFRSVIFLAHSRSHQPVARQVPRTGQHQHRINVHTDIHALSGIWTHDPNVLASDDSSCLRPYSHSERAAINGKEAQF